LSGKKELQAEKKGSMRFFMLFLGSIAKDAKKAKDAKGLSYTLGHL
jgi:hypothetical protein